MITGYWTSSEVEDVGKLNTSILKAPLEVALLKLAWELAVCATFKLFVLLLHVEVETLSVDITISSCAYLL